jgi:hypothetical protein
LVNYNGSSGAISGINGYCFNLGDKAFLIMQIGHHVSSQNHVYCDSHLDRAAGSHNQFSSKYVLEGHGLLCRSYTFSWSGFDCLTKGEDG